MYIARTLLSYLLFYCIIDCEFYVIAGVLCTVTMKNKQGYFR